jgi:hypothetical protein
MEAPPAAATLPDDLRLAVVLALLVACRNLLEGSLTVRWMCWLPSPALLAGEAGAGPRDTEAMPFPERRELRDDMVRCSAVSRSLSLSAMSVIASVARWAAERRGRVDMMRVGEMMMAG